MLIRFTVGNFLSFNENQEFSMIAEDLGNNKLNHLYKDDFIELLKFSSVFGANASGKSNLVYAMNFAQYMIINDFPKNSIFSYYKLLEENKEKSSYFEFEIKVANKYYAYGFEVILSKQTIISEWLYELSPTNDNIKIFTRDILKGEYVIENYFNNKTIEEKLNFYANDIKSDGSILLLRELNRNKDTLYEENEELNIFREIFNWFKKQLNIKFPNRPISNYPYFISTENFKNICAMLSAFGTGITNYDVVEINYEKVASDVPDEILQDIIVKLNNIRINEKENDYKIELYKLFLRGSKSLYIFEIDPSKNDEQCIIYKTIQFNHGNSRVFFDLHEESDGSIRLLDLLSILFENKSETIFVIDEIDRCLHPQLTYKFITEYFKSVLNKEIQLIVTTHESRLLDFNLLRKDEIWIINKKNSGESIIYSLAEYNDEFDNKIEKAYLEGRYGGVPVFSAIFPNQEEG